MIHQLFRHKTENVDHLDGPSNNYSKREKMKSRGQKELDQYIFKRPEMAKLLGISTNALRCRMRKGKCDLEYRFDGRNFMFKRPSSDMVNGPPLDPLRPHMKKLLGTTTGKSKIELIEGQHMKTMGEDQFVKENTLNPVSNTIMR